MKSKKPSLYDAQEEQIQLQSASFVDFLTRKGVLEDHNIDNERVRKAKKDEDPSFVLADYGLESEVFAVISIPALELEMPVFLGANYRHMADGAALLGQTSIPIGGKNTNCIIAGHRGWGGASYFRYVDKLQPGDEVIITNLWETLQYRVAEIQIIQPNEVEQILIKPGQELVTLLTCHPYASGGRQRYLVICERVNENN